MTTIIVPLANGNDLEIVGLQSARVCDEAIQIARAKAAEHETTVYINDVEGYDGHDGWRAVDEDGTLRRLTRGELATLEVDTSGEDMAAAMDEVVQ